MDVVDAVHALLLHLTSFFPFGKPLLDVDFMITAIG